MIKKELTDKFFNAGLELKAENEENIKQLRYSEVVSLFERMGLIIFRDFKIDPKDLTEITSMYTETFANDAQREKIDGSEGSKQCR